VASTPLRGSRGTHAAITPRLWRFCARTYGNTPRYRNAKRIEPKAFFPQVDVQAAIAALVRRETSFDVPETTINLDRTDLRGARMEGGDFRRASFAGSNLQLTRLSKANLERASFVGARLHGADLEEITAHNAVFSFATMSGCKLAGAHLEGASLNSVTFTGMSLPQRSGPPITLHDADLSNAHLAGARADMDTEWPESFDAAAAGVTETT
jgi:uncharacterized protein YjbI with pentapeptide repeats